MISGVCVEMVVIFMDISRKRSLTNPLTLMSKKLLILSFLDRNY